MVICWNSLLSLLVCVYKKNIWTNKKEPLPNDNNANVAAVDISPFKLVIVYTAHFRLSLVHILHPVVILWNSICIDIARKCSLIELSACQYHSMRNKYNTPDSVDNKNSTEKIWRSAVFLLLECTSFYVLVHLYVCRCRILCRRFFV